MKNTINENENLRKILLTYHIIDVNFLSLAPILVQQSNVNTPKVWPVVAS